MTVNIDKCLHIFPPHSVDFIHKSDNYYQSMKFLSIHGFGLTITMSTNHWENIFKKNYKDASEYYHQYLTDLGYIGIGIIEFTKAGVPHVHAYIPELPIELDENHKFYKFKKNRRYTYYRDPRIDVNNCISVIRSDQQLKAHFQYMSKECTIPNSILMYYQTRDS